MAFSKLAVLALLALQSASVFAAKNIGAPLHVDISDVSFPDNHDDEGVYIINHQPVGVVITIRNYEPNPVTVISIRGSLKHGEDTYEIGPSVYNEVIQANTDKPCQYLFGTNFSMGQASMSLELRLWALVTATRQDITRTAVITVVDETVSLFQD